MAEATVDFAYHGTLTADAADTITLKGNQSVTVEVYNRGEEGDIYFTTNDRPPAIGAVDTYIVGPKDSYIASAPGGVDVVRLICSEANPYSVIGAPVLR